MTYNPGKDNPAGGSRFGWGPAQIEVLDAPVKSREKVYDPDQPHVPAGSPEGGEWGDDGSSSLRGNLSPHVAASEARGHVGTKDDPIPCGANLDLAVRALADGKSVRLRQPDQVATLLEKLDAVCKDAKGSPEKQFLKSSSVLSSTDVGGDHVCKVQDLELANGVHGMFKPEKSMDASGRKGMEEERFAEREAVCSDVADVIGLRDLVPPTVVRDVDGERGSLMKFVDDAEVAARLDPDVRYDGETDLARAGAFDYLMGNTDRHMKNWMIDGTEKLHLIDNGLCLPNDNAAAPLMNAMILTELEHRSAMIPQEVKTWSWPKIAEAIEKQGFSQTTISHAADRFNALQHNSTFDELKENGPVSWVRHFGDTEEHRQGARADWHQSEHGTGVTHEHESYQSSIRTPTSGTGVTHDSNGKPIDWVVEHHDRPASNPANRGPSKHPDSVTQWAHELAPQGANASAPTSAINDTKVPPVYGRPIHYDADKPDAARGDTPLFPAITSIQEGVSHDWALHGRDTSQERQQAPANSPWPAYKDPGVTPKPDASSASPVTGQSGAVSRIKLPLGIINPASLSAKTPKPRKSRKKK